MRVLAVQKKTLGTPAKNLERVRRMLEDAAAPDVIVLPEIFTCPYDNSCFPVFAQEEGGEVCRELSKIAVEHHAWLGWSEDRFLRGKVTGYTILLMFMTGKAA